MKEQYISVEEARALLRVSKTKIAAMIEKKELIASIDPLNKRRKRIKLIDVEAIKKRSEAVQ